MESITKGDVSRALRKVTDYKAIPANDIRCLEFKKTARMLASANNYYRVTVILADGKRETLAGSWGGPWIVALVKHLTEEWGSEPVWLDKKYISVDELWQM